MSSSIILVPTDGNGIKHFTIRFYNNATNGLDCDVVRTPIAL